MTPDPSAGDCERKIPATGSNAQPAVKPNPPQKRAGLGDNVAAALALVGVTEESVSAWMGAPCKCGERKRKLNEIGSWAMRVLSGSREQPPIEV